MLISLIAFCVVCKSVLAFLCGNCVGQQDGNCGEQGFGG